MLKSVLPKTTGVLFCLVIVLQLVFIYGFGPGMTERDWLTYSNRCLSETYDPAPGDNLKKWEIILTDDHFIRLRKTYQHGKQEYFSFNLNRLDSVNYLGTTNYGLLRFKTLKDDIIVQTYDDPKGDIDSMATLLSIPVKNISAERLDSLNGAIMFFKHQNL